MHRPFITALALALAAPAMTRLEAGTILGQWDFEGGYVDSSGNGHSGTPAGSHSFVSDTSSLAPGGLSVTNPLGTYIDVPSFTGPANDFTAELFFKSTQTTGLGHLMTTYDHTFTDGDGIGGWAIFLDEGRVGFATRGPGGSVSTILSAPTSSADGAWHHVAATLSDTNLMGLYLDGTLVGQVQGQLSGPDRNRLRFGMSHSIIGDPYRFTGSLDAARITSGVLTPSQFITAVPEPSTLTLAGVGALTALGMGWWRRRP